MVVYHDCVKGMKNIFDVRLRMAEYAKAHGVSAGAREFKTTRDTIRKWRNRYEKEGLEGLKNKSRRPKCSPKKIPVDIEVRLVNLRTRHPRWGPLRLKDNYEGIPSPCACYRVWHENPDCMKPKRKKWQKQKDLREIKKKMRAFEKSQVDTKDLNDILHYWPQKYELGLPRYQYSLREMSSGCGFFAYSDENNSTNAARFAYYVLNHLANNGVDISGCEFQDDNGSEFIGSARKKSKRPTAFQEVLLSYNVKQGRIPPRAPTWNSDVEALHRLIEEEFYDSEDFSCEDNFLAKAFSYQIWFNFARRNRWRDNLTPWEILKQKNPNLTKEALLLAPIRLESLPLPNELCPPQGVDHVSRSVRRAKYFLNP